MHLGRFAVTRTVFGKLLLLLRGDRNARVEKNVKIEVEENSRRNFGRMGLGGLIEVYSLRPTRSI